MSAPPPQLPARRPPRRRLRVFAAALSAVVLTALLLANAVLQPEPTVTAVTDVDTADVGRVLSLARAHDPRRVPPGQLSTVVLGERDIDVLVNHLGWSRLGVPTRVQLGQGWAEVDGCLHLRANAATRLLGRWVNLHLRLIEQGGTVQVQALRVGGLPLPASWALPLARWAASSAGMADELDMALDLVQRVNLHPQRVALGLMLRNDSAERLAAAVVSPREQQRLRAYSDRLVALASAVQGNSTSLAHWIGPMFELARQRSAAGSDAAAENRAAILVLTLYANGRRLDSLLPAARSWPRARQHRLTLAGRDDSPLHLLISAALVVEGTGPLSKAVGIFKEVADSRGGSGFSFNDLAADRAGTRLGELALQQPQRLQAALASGVQESDFMPHAADLPESMAEPEFKRRYGGVGEPRYVAMVDEIDRRVSALRALR